MQVLWRGAQGLTVHQLIEQLPRQVAYTTALTTLRILERKGYVYHKPHPDGGRAHVYLPTEPAQTTRRVHARSLIDRLFGGHPRELLVGLLENGRLEAKELEELRELLDKKLNARRQGKKGK